MYFTNGDDEPHDLVLRLRGTENEQFQQEFSRSLQPGADVTACGTIDLEPLDGNELVAETRLDDDEPRQHEFPPGFDYLGVVIDEEASVSFSRGRA